MAFALFFAAPVLAFLAAGASGSNIYIDGPVQGSGPKGSGSNGTVAPGATGLYKPPKIIKLEVGQGLVDTVKAELDKWDGITNDSNHGKAGDYGDDV